MGGRLRTTDFFSILGFYSRRVGFLELSGGILFLTIGGILLGLAISMELCLLFVALMSSEKFDISLELFLVYRGTEWCHLGISYSV